MMNRDRCRALSAEEKQKYEAMAAEDATTFQSEMTQYPIDLVAAQVARQAQYKADVKRADSETHLSNETAVGENDDDLEALFESIPVGVQLKIFDKLLDIRDYEHQYRVDQFSEKF